MEQTKQKQFQQDRQNEAQSQIQNINQSEFISNIDVTHTNANTKFW